MAPMPSQSHNEFIPDLILGNGGWVLSLLIYLDYSNIVTLYMSWCDVFCCSLNNSCSSFCLYRVYTLFHYTCTKVLYTAIFIKSVAMLSQWYKNELESHYATYDPDTETNHPNSWLHNYCTQVLTEDCLLKQPADTVHW